MACFEINGLYWSIKESLRDSLWDYSREFQNVSILAHSISFNQVKDLMHSILLLRLRIVNLLERAILWGIYLNRNFMCDPRKNRNSKMMMNSNQMNYRHHRRLSYDFFPYFQLLASIFLHHFHWNLLLLEYLLSSVLKELFSLSLSLYSSLLTMVA